MVDMKKKATDILEDYSNFYSQVDLETLTKFLEQIKSEAIKEFAGRLKFELEVAFDEPIFDTIIGKIIESNIDKILKEVIGDK